MLRGAVILVFTALLASATAWAQADVPAEKTRILVTIADPGLAGGSRVGPARPGYNRHSARYLASVNVRRVAKKLAQEHGLEIVDEWPIVPLEVHCIVLETDSIEAAESLLVKLRANPEVDSAQLLNRFEASGSHATSPSDPYAKLQHNHDVLQIGRAHDWSRGDGARITIIDTGADYKHPELKTQIQARHNFVDAHKSDFAGDAHGTAIAGVIAAAANNDVGMTGVAPAARLTVLKACWYPDGNTTAVCDSFTLAKALAHAVDSDTEIINLSLGGPPDALLSRLVKVALEANIVVVAAAQTGSEVGFPADVAGVIVVGSEPDADAIATRVSAPGEEILVPVPGGGFDYASGSSLSAAQVSGVAALLVAKRPGLRREEVTELLLGSQGATGNSVNACRALSNLLQQAGCEAEAEAAVSQAH